MMEPLTFTSKALLANLQQTRVSEIKYDPKYDLLQTIFTDFPALKNQISFLLKEIFHPYRNNLLVLEDFRSFFLRNLPVILNSPYKSKGLYFVFELLFTFFGNDKATNIKACEIYYSLLEKTIENMDNQSFQEISPILKEILKAGAELPQEIFGSFLENYYSFKRLAKKLINFKLDKEFIEVVSFLLKKYYSFLYNFWSQDGKLKFFKIEDYKNILEKKELSLFELLELPDHLDLIREVKNYIQKICGEDEKILTEEEKIAILFDFIENPNLQLIHEELLKEINQILIKMIEKQPSERLEDFLIKFFAILKEKKTLYPRTAFECIKNTSRSILNKRAVYLAEVLINEIIKYGFFPPQIEGIDEHWKIKANPNHLLNIKYWIEIFRIHPEWCSSLLAALHLNLRLYGLSLKDTDLFQREITALLNAPIRPIYNLVKQFCKIFPVYFNEIGAEGLIRDLSTEIDEMFQRKDTLLHFLRKFIHIENSSLAIDFIRDIFYFWFTLDSSYIKKYLPEPIWKRVVKEELFYHIPMQNLLMEIFKIFSKYQIEDLLEMDLNFLKTMLSNINFDEKCKTKLINLIHLYNLEKQKYYGYLTDLDTFVSQYKELGFDFIQELSEILNEKNEYQKLNILLKWLEDLKENYILSEKKFEPIEEIIIKRHIAVDIPSMYGKYKEKKFDALGLTYRLEYIVDKIFAKIVENFTIDYLNKNHFYKILKILKTFKKALEIDGISSKKFNLYLDLLENSLKSYPLSFNQYLDIFKGLNEGVQHIIKSYYINPYLKVFPIVYEVLKEEALLEKYKKGIQGKSDEEKYYCLSEMVLRDILNSGFIIKYLDQFLKKVYQALIKSKENVKDEDLNLLLTFDGRKSLSFLYKPNLLAKDLIYLGSKAFSLIQLFQCLPPPMKIPLGFVLTTEIFRCYKLFKKYPILWKEYENLINEAIKTLEEKMGKKFGDRVNPLLLSVRSGAAISMPGMMTSILNVGINPEIAEGLAERTQNLWFAWDTYRRFIQNWAMALGVPRDFFNRLMREHKRKYGVKLKREFSGEEMRELALLYRKEVEKLGIHVVDDPLEQLFKSIEFILNSWYHKKAVYYREIMEIAEEWGTAVIVQEMVFGNLGPKSGTGVTFTTSPHGKFPRILLWGDYTPYNQGEDIVSGLVNAYPISIEQKRIENREGPSLEEAFPEIYKALLNLAYKLVYEEGWDHQEIEFTFQSENPEDLYILQVRDIILREEKILPGFKKRALANLIYLGRGIGVSGGIISGRAVFNLEDILRLKEEGTPLILLRYDTVPDNIKEMSMVDGILTARGGQTSHAAIVAGRLGKVCVVGCEELRIDESEKSAKLKEEVIKLGDWITINGITGDIYKGKIQNIGGSYEIRH
ncbi:MAG: PEP/pyruvate-binding domain-containing protein [Caldimicrobium sp.]